MFGLFSVPGYNSITTQSSGHFALTRQGRGWEGGGGEGGGDGRGGGGGGGLVINDWYWDIGTSPVH